MPATVVALCHRACLMLRELRRRVPRAGTPISAITERPIVTDERHGTAAGRRKAKRRASREKKAVRKHPLACHAKGESRIAWRRRAERQIQKCRIQREPIGFSPPPKSFRWLRDPEARWIRAPFYSGFVGFIWGNKFLRPNWTKLEYVVEHCSFINVYVTRIARQVVEVKLSLSTSTR